MSDRKAWAYQGCGLLPPVGYGGDHCTPMLGICNGVDPALLGGAVFHLILVSSGISPTADDLRWGNPWRDLGVELQGGYDETERKNEGRD